MLFRSLVITVSKKPYRPADRIVSLDIKVIPEDFEFTSFTAAATQTMNVDIDKLSLTTTNQLSAELDPTFAGWLKGAGKLAGSTQSALGEAADVSVNPESLNVNLDGDTLYIHREAERGYDLTGNTLVAVNLSPKPPQTDADVSPSVQYDLVVTALTLQDKTGKTLAPGAASISTTHTAYLIPSSLHAKVTYSYVIRHVEKIGRAHV